jgi:hypothetical protein
VNSNGLNITRTVRIFADVLRLFISQKEKLKTKIKLRLICVVLEEEFKYI